MELSYRTQYIGLLPIVYQTSHLFHSTTPNGLQPCLGAAVRWSPICSLSWPQGGSTGQRPPTTTNVIHATQSTWHISCVVSESLSRRFSCVWTSTGAWFTSHCQDAAEVGSVQDMIPLSSVPTFPWFRSSGLLSPHLCLCYTHALSWLVPMLTGDDGVLWWRQATLPNTD